MRAKVRDREGVGVVHLECALHIYILQIYFTIIHVKIDKYINKSLNG